MRLLIIEDDPIIRETVSVCFCLRWPDTECVGSETGEEGIKLVTFQSFDLIFLDVGLPGIDGHEALCRLRGITDTPVIMLTARNDEVSKIKGLERGSDDYITKPFSHIELMARARSVLLRSKPASLDEIGGKYVYEPAGLEMDLDARTVTRNGRPINLAPLEYRLLYHLTQHQGQVMSHRSLLAKVWGQEYAEAEDYLKVYIRRLRAKLGDDLQEPELIHNKRGMGYMFQVRPRIVEAVPA